MAARLRLPAWTRQWVADSRLLLASQLLAVATTTALAVILARVLGPAEWGIFSALLGLSLALSTFVELGLGTWMLRELSRLRVVSEDAAAFRGRATSSRLAAAFAANATFGLVLLGTTLVVALAFIGLERDLARALAGLIAYTICLTSANTLESFFRAERRLKTVVVALLVERTLLLGLVGVALLTGFGLSGIGLAYFLAGAARLSLVSLILLFRERLAVARPALVQVRRVVVGGVPFALGTVSLNVIPRLDTVLIAAFSATAAGYYALGDRILGPALIVPVVASTALYPFLSRDVADSRPAFGISRLMLLAGASLTVAGIAVAPVLVPAIFGAEYGSAVGVVQVMLCALPFIYAANPLLTDAYSRGYERRVFIVTLVMSLAGTAAIIGGLLAIGVVAAAAGLVLRYVLFTLALLWIARRPGRATETALGPPGVSAPGAGTARVE